MRVVCLEQGDWQEPARYPGAGPDWELQAAQAVGVVAQRSRAAGRLPDRLRRRRHGPRQFQRRRRRHRALQRGRGPASCPSDFRTRTEHGIADDWPLSYAELAPHYEETDRQFGVSGLGGNPVYPPGVDPPLPPLPIGRAGLALARAHARSRVALVARVQRDLVGRARRTSRVRAAGVVRVGVQRGREGFDRRHALAARHRRRRALVTGARCGGSRSTARAAPAAPRGSMRDGHEHFQAADVVVCAANGIGTSRLLLLSAHAGAPDGLANSSGWSAGG